MGSSLEILCGDSLTELRKLPTESVHCCVTSPPYWGLRDYSANGQLGLEKTPEQYVAKMVEIFREVRRVLRKDGTLWLNLGDSYAGGGGGPKPSNIGGDCNKTAFSPSGCGGDGLKPKDLVGIPWRVAFALQADGWYLRSDIIWSKPNPMPESVTDRPTKAHEYLFLLTKSPRYFYDAEAIKEAPSQQSVEWNKYQHPRADDSPHSLQGSSQNNGRIQTKESGRNKRSVWTVATAPYPEAHFATYPPDLIKPCILAGTSAKGCCAKCGAPWERIIEIDRIGNSLSNPEKLNCLASEGLIRGGLENRRLGPVIQDSTKTLGWQPTCECAIPGFHGAMYDTAPCTVLDPFAGSGTTGAVALELGRKAILIELNPKYVELINQRCNVTMGLQLA
jgi:DNA modification methylase